MRPPRFWDQPPGVRSALLSPLAAVYAAATRTRLARGRACDLGIPVICVGNINVGGTGKTPVVIALAERLVARGRAVHIVSRGYGGSDPGPKRVDPTRHSAAQVGDEPLLLAAFAPTWVARDRAAGGQAAKAAGAEVILLDDGHQNPALKKDRSLVVVDAARGFGNGRVLPAGPLREPVATGLARGDMVITIGPPEDQNNLSLPANAPPRCPAGLVPLRTGMPWAGLRAFAFAGIGNPGKFFATLRQLDVDLVGTRALDDHQPLTPALLGRLQRDADAAGARLVTTEKDAVRLPASLRGQVLTLPVRLQFEDPDQIDDLLLGLGL